MLNLSKLRLFASNAKFFQKLNEQSIKYQKNNVLKTLKTNLRDFVLKWLKNQFEFISLNDFKTIISKTYSQTFAFVLTINFDQIIINFSSRYHRCFECVVQFSSISRFFIHVQKNDCIKIFTCKQCDEIFASNNKLYEHLRHYKNNDKTLKYCFKKKYITIDQLRHFFHLHYLFYRLHLNRCQHQFRHRIYLILWRERKLFVLSHFQLFFHYINCINCI